MGLASQIGLLLWKNWLLQKRKICVSIFEILLPVFFAVLIALLRIVIPTSVIAHPTTYSVQNASHNVYFPYNSKNVVIFGYAPRNSETTRLMESMVKMVKERAVREYFHGDFNITGFATEQQALRYYDILREYNLVHQIIVFHGVSNSDTKLPKDIKFSIRPVTRFRGQWQTDRTFPIFQSLGPRYTSSDYQENGFLLTQALLGEALAKYWLEEKGENSTIRFGAYGQRMAYPPYYIDPLIPVLKNVFPLLVVLSFILSVIINTKNLVYEKEQKLKESMKLMGMHASAHWLSWFITFMIYLVPALALFAFLFGQGFSKSGPVLANSDPTLFFAFLLSYGVALITFCFMVSTFVQKANIGAAMAGVLFFAFYIAYTPVANRYETMSRGNKFAAGLLFNVAMAQGITVIGIYEGTGEGAHWSNFHEPGVADDNLSLLDCILMLLIDTFIHCVITWYVDSVRPGDFGVPQPYNFCFTKTYWFGSKDSSNTLYDDEPSTQNPKCFEKDPTGLNAGIQISNLRKVFGSNVAVHGTSMKMYDGQITVLLGHNGAGKTTTMSMLTGFIPPSSGTAQINGCDIRENIQGVRSSLGLCPQHDILFDTLTVREHLKFFAKLKGLSGPSIEEEVIATCKEVGLETKLNDFSRSLSGGQKRKLSVGIALIGGSKVVILDEPSSGMDPAARRQTWNVLQRARQGRTILLSTHYMDEADLLGDRIAIMADGAIKCCGSSMFLKKLYGTGYTLVVVKRHDCNVEQLTKVIQSYVRTAEFESVINTEVLYVLPDGESARFPALFTELDERQGELGIASFGTSATTMEEVFLKVGENASILDNDDKKTNNGNETATNGFRSNSVHSSPVTSYKKLNADNQDNDEGTFSSSVDDEGLTARPHSRLNNIEPEEQEMVEVDMTGNAKYFDPKASFNAFNRGFLKITGTTHTLAVIRALFVKKAIFTWRNRVFSLVQCLLPIIFTIIALLALGDIGAGPDVEDMEPALTLDLKPFGRSYIPYTAGLNAENQREKLAKLYAKQFGSTQNLEKFSITSELNNTFDTYALKRSKELGVATYNKRIVIGLEAKEPVDGETISAISHFNGQPFHSAAIGMNYMINTFLQYTLDESYSMQSINHPLPEDQKKNEDRKAAANSFQGFLVGLLMGFGMAFLTTMVIYFLIKERQVGAKHMQVVSGVGPITYWVPTMMWDYINYIVPCVAIVIVIAAFPHGREAYLDNGRAGAIILVLVLFGWAVMPFLYAVQFLFNSPPTGVVMAIILNIFSGTITTTIVFILTLPGLKQEQRGNQIDGIVSLIFPSHNMAFCFSNIYQNFIKVQECDNTDCAVSPYSACCKDFCEKHDNCFDRNMFAWDRPGVGSYVFFMALQGFMYWAIVMLIEYHIFQKIWYRINRRSADDSYCDTSSVDDSDVAEEKQRVNAISKTNLSSKDGDDSLLLVNLYKRYNNFVAVDNISLGVPEQECFGLLGQNGAGKTTTFKMLTGDVMVTNGNAYLKGYDVRNNIKKVQANMGYCPQFDALIDQMTGRETLTMYARIRGVPEPDIKQVVDGLIDSLMLEPHADKLAGAYSGGNKRKLSTAMALVGDPPFIMLDEPSSGMDPKARRQLWNVLSQVRASGRTLVLTSHSMEECDALCTRLAIMVNGRFKCLGSPQHLKSKFGQGYTLIVQLGALQDGSTAPNQPVIDCVMQKCPGSKVFDDHQGYVHFQVPDQNIKLAAVFSLMEWTKANLNVQDYSVHQTTLEQVFLSFTRSQNPAKEDKSHSPMTKLCCFCCIKMGLFN